MLRCYVHLHVSEFFPPFLGDHGDEPDREPGPGADPRGPHRPQDRVPAARREDQAEDLQHPHEQNDPLGRRQRGGVHHVQGRALRGRHQGTILI